MKTKLTKIIMSSLAFACASVCLAATMALSTSATAQSAPDRQVCSAGMLRGLYLWTLDGYQNFGGNPVPKDLLEGIRFNGDGTLSVPFGTVNIGGTIVIDVSGGVGTYTVADDCTGTLTITDGPTFNMYVGPGARQLWILNTGGGPGGRHRTRFGNGDTAAVVKAPRLLRRHRTSERLWVWRVSFAPNPLCFKR